jgi:hypothetical protein
VEAGYIVEDSYSADADNIQEDSFELVDPWVFVEGCELVVGRIVVMVRAFVVVGIFMGLFELFLVGFGDFIVGACYLLFFCPVSYMLRFIKFFYLSS